MDKCPNCPVADRPCLAQLARHPRYCELIDPASPICDPRYKAIIEAGPDAPPPAPEPPARIPVDESLRLLQRMTECPSRTSEAGCGCGGMARCALGKGRDGLVNHIDCFACLQATASGT